MAHRKIHQDIQTDFLEHLNLKEGIQGPKIMIKPIIYRRKSVRTSRGSLKGIENAGPRAKSKSLFKQRMEAKRQQKKNREAQPSKSTAVSSCCHSDAMDVSNPTVNQDEDLKKIHLENSRRLAELRIVSF